jgi:hypothetical protein
VQTTTRQNDHVLFSIVHRALRQDFARLEQAVDDLTLADRADRRRGMARWFRGFPRLVRHHHAIEFRRFWSALEERVGPDPGVRHLDAEFPRLDAALGEVCAAFRVLQTSEAFVVPQRELVLAIRHARHVLDELLEVEETQVIPRFSSEFAHGEFGPVDERVHEGLGIRGVAFAIPWAIGAMTEQERARLLPAVPPALRLAYRVFRLYYQWSASALELWAPRSLRLAV